MPSEPINAWRAPLQVRAFFPPTERDRSGSHHSKTHTPSPIPANAVAACVNLSLLKGGTDICVGCVYNGPKESGVSMSVLSNRGDWGRAAEFHLGSLGLTSVAWGHQHLAVGTASGAVLMFRTPVDEVRAGRMSRGTAQQTLQQRQETPLRTSRWVGSERVADLALQATERGGVHLATAIGETLSLWDISTSACMASHNNLTEVPFTSTAWISPVSPLLAAASAGGTVGVWDSRIGSERWAVQLRSSELPRAVLQCVRPNHINEHWLATGGDDGVVRVWDIRAASHPALALPPMTDAVTSLSWHRRHPGLIIAGAADGVSCLSSIRAATGHTLKMFPSLGSQIVSAEMGPDVDGSSTCVFLSELGKLCSEQITTRFLNPTIPSCFGEEDVEERKVESLLFSGQQHLAISQLQRLLKQYSNAPTLPSQSLALERLLAPTDREYVAKFFEITDEFQLEATVLTMPSITTHSKGELSPEWAPLRFTLALICHVLSEDIQSLIDKLPQIKAAPPGSIEPGLLRHCINTIKSKYSLSTQAMHFGVEIATMLRRQGLGRTQLLSVVRGLLEPSIYDSEDSHATSLPGSPEPIQWSRERPRKGSTSRRKSSTRKPQANLSTMLPYPESISKELDFTCNLLSSMALCSSAAALGSRDSNMDHNPITLVDAHGFPILHAGALLKYATFLLRNKHFARLFVLCGEHQALCNGYPFADTIRDFATRAVPDYLSALGLPTRSPERLDPETVVLKMSDDALIRTFVESLAISASKWLPSQLSKHVFAIVSISSRQVQQRLSQVKEIEGESIAEQRTEVVLAKLVSVLTANQHRFLDEQGYLHVSPYFEGLLAFLPAEDLLDIKARFTGEDVLTNVGTSAGGTGAAPMTPARQ